MNRDANYMIAKDRVKISHFTEQGYDIKGIVHVGTNDGYEMQWYQMMGIKNLIGVEPLPSAAHKFKEHYPEIPLLQCALSNRVEPDPLVLHVAPGDGQGSTLLYPVNPEPFDMDIPVSVTTWQDLVRESAGMIKPEDYDCLVVDVQGMEMQVLEGFGNLLKHFRMLNIECSREPVYRDGAPAGKVECFLKDAGFVRDSRIEDHNDIFFVRRHDKINVGSGQRPFGRKEDGPSWTNVDPQVRWQADVIAEADSMPMFKDNSAQIVCIHHVLEHMDLSSADAAIRECYRILRPGGSLLIFVPDLYELTKAWSDGRIDDYTFGVNLWGAYMGDDHDIHRWGYTQRSLTEKLYRAAEWSHVEPFNWRTIPGAEIAKDWWILGIEAWK